MNVILIQDVDKLGALGETVKVKDGYARNYLIPRGLAMAATSGALAIIAQKKKTKEKQEQARKEEYVKIAAKLKNISPIITMEAGAEDKLFGSVTSDMIAESLTAEGIEVDKKKIVLAEPIKALGVYTIDIKLHPEITAQLKIWVVKK